MKAYNFYIFLMFDTSIERVAGALVREGFTVKPNLTNEKLAYKSDDGISTVMCMELTHKDNNRDVVHGIIQTLLKKKEVPYYGFVLSESNGAAKFDCGFSPVLKEKAAVPTGPYRTNVIPFEPKDNGIVDE